MAIVLWPGDISYVDRIQSLLAAAVGNPSEQSVMALLNGTYRESGARLDMIFDGPELVGVVGSLRIHPGLAEILHMAVDAPYRGKGWGRMAIQHLRTDVYPDVWLMAETDRDAVGFYAQLGFHVTSLGEKYPGRERFQCVLKP
jgi:ribosomal protein S18 acetylase RimI-like enzyme